MKDITYNKAVMKSCNEISNEELMLINSYTRRDYTRDELYVFRVVLCDNEVDRDNEAFSVEALQSMSRLFIGKTGIADHNPSAQNQTARIFVCEVENVPEVKTQYGADYCRLVAKAYIPRSNATEEIIEQIESGIRKEVSVGCRAEKIVCSVCGADVRTSPCEHYKGNEYNGKLCYHILGNITDAYEWSFVAVPSQRKAGVIKSFALADNHLTREENMESIVNEIKKGNYKALNSQNVEWLAKYVSNLEKYAECGKVYRNQLEKDYVKYSQLCFDDCDNEVLNTVAKKLSIDELKGFVEMYKKRTEKENFCKPQLYVQTSKIQNYDNNQYNI
ncbi:MAG: hypothetical protein U0M12_04005 [Acutalibacteraceae bacterium]|nr:hypothetical protein [Acutalibacteraceae bacterium]